MQARPAAETSVAEPPAAGASAAESPTAAEAQVAALEARVAALESELARLRHLLRHDLPAPLRHITGYAQVIDEDFGPGLDPQLAAHLATMAKAAATLRALIAKAL